MKTTITAKNMVVSPGITNRIMKKTATMERYLKPDTQMYVRLRKERNQRIAEITEETRVRKRALKADYRKAQMELECTKQQLRTDWILEHGEPEDDTNASRIARQMA